MKRDDLLTMLTENQVQGLWSETLFPALKHMISYGADQVKGKKLDNWVDAALDTALFTLSGLAPELAPGMAALRKGINKPVHSAAEKMRSAIKDWSVTGRRDRLELEEVKEEDFTGAANWRNQSMVDQLVSSDPSYCF